MNVNDVFNQIRAVADPWPNAFIENDLGRLKLAWALPSHETCPPGHFRNTHEGIVLGFANGAIRIIALRKDGLRSERPSDHVRWLQAMNIPEV